MGEGSTDQPDVSASCPGAETLRAFLDERLDEARASRVIAHLAACGRCDDEVAVLAAAGAVTGLERSTADTAIGSFAARLRAQRPPRRPLPKVAPSIPGLRDLEPVGRGGMGVVYRGTETATGETVAVKVLWTVGGLTDSAHARARREVEALGRIDDPGIVRIRHAGVCDGGPLEPDGVPYIVMEWIDGETLQRRLGARALAVNDAAVVIRDLARVLARVHGLGIVHRDIKPANVFLIPAPKTGDTLTPKLVDFGLARPEESAACGTFGDLAGTPGYMAPEQWHGDGALGVIGPATDIYGLGATLFFLLVGRPPNDGRPTLAGTSALAASPPEWHAADRPPIPVDLRTIVEKCLRVAPLERYASAGELADDLGRFLGGLPITARKAAISERVVTWVGHNPAKTVAAILTTLFVGMAATGAWLHAVGLSAANQTANVARHRAEDALQRLTGKWIERMIKRGEALDRADREFLREVCDQYRSWPLEPDPVAGLRFRAEGLGKIASILGTLEDRGEAGALYEEAIGVLDVCGSLDGDASALASQRLALLEANYQLFTFVNPGPTISLAAPRIIRLLDDPAARDVRSAADRCVVALARLNLVLATTDWGQAVGADGRTPPLDALDACLRDIDAIAAMYPTEPIVEVTRINGLMASADATWRHFGTAALDRLRLAAVIAQRSAERFPSTDDLNRFSRQHVLTLAKQCDVARGLGDHDASLATARVLKALVAERGKADQSPDLFYRGEGIEAAIREANALVSLGRPQECEGALVEALEHATRSAREQPAVFTHAGRLTKLLLCQSTALQAMHRKAEAARSIRQIADILRPWQASAERSAWTAAIIQNVHVHAGNLLLEAGDPDGAIDDFRKLIRIAPPERRVDAAGYLLNAGRAARRLDVVGEAFGWMMRDEKVRAAVSARLGITGPVNQTDASPESAAGP